MWRGQLPLLIVEFSGEGRNSRPFSMGGMGLESFILLLLWDGTTPQSHFYNILYLDIITFIYSHSISTLVMLKFVFICLGCRKMVPESRVRSNSKKLFLQNHQLERKKSDLAWRETKLMGERKGNFRSVWEGECPILS